MSGHAVPTAHPEQGAANRTAHEAVREALERDVALDAEGVEILVDGDEIFLSGTVFRPEDVARAAEIAAAAGGGKAVINRLVLFSEPGNDSDLETDTRIDGSGHSGHTDPT